MPHILTLLSSARGQASQSTRVATALTTRLAESLLEAMRQVELLAARARVPKAAPMPVAEMPAHQAMT